MCVLTRASSAIDYTTCNDINYAALGALTSKMANAADSCTPCRPNVGERKQLTW